MQCSKDGACPIGTVTALNAGVTKMVDKVMDSSNETAPLVEAIDATPEISAVEAKAPTDAAPAAPIKPVKDRKVKAKAVAETLWGEAQ